MKNRFNLFLGSLVAIGLSQSAQAVDYTWNGTTTGTWDTSGTNWAGLPTDPWISTNGLNNKAIFNLADLAATVSGTVYTNGITFTTTGALSGGTINMAGTAPTLSVAASQTGSIGSTISGTTGLTKADTGTLILSGANDYTGGTAINAGTIQVNTGGTLGSTIGALSMGTGSPGVLGTVGNLTVNTDTQVGAFTVKSNTSDTTTASNIGQLSVASGKTLTVSSFSVGVSQGATNNAINTALATGSSNTGTLTVTGDVTVGLSDLGTAGSAITVADLSGLANFNAGSGAGNFRVGYGRLNRATLTLASTANVINVAAISVGETINNGNSGQNNILNLGAGTNALQAANINVGTQKASGVIQFAGAGGSVTITGAGGTGSANITLGNHNSSGGYQPGNLNNRLLLAGHTATVSAGTVLIGNRSSTGTGTVTAELTFDTGTFNATGITLARASSGNTTNASAVNGTLTLGTSSATTGVTTVSGSVVLANHTSTTTGVIQTATGILTINSGTVNVNTAASTSGGILDTSTTTSGISNTTLTLDGGTLNLNGGVIGGNGSSGNRAITNLNFRSGTLQNVLQINNGAILTKTTAGTLTLGGINSYTGVTLISEGKLVAASTNALGTAGFFTSRTTISTGGTLEIATDTSIANEFLDVATNNTGAVVVNRATAGAGITQSTGTTYLGSTSALNVTQGSNVTSGTATLGIASVILASESVGTGTLNSDTAAISVTGSVSSGVDFSKTLALAGSHTASEISGAISNGSGNVSLTKSGSGTWTISNSDNSYTGATTISGGKLVINGNISTSTTTVKENGTLAGIGTVGAVLVETGGRLAIGNSTGTMTFAGDLTLELNSISDFEINGFGTGEYDLARARVEDPQISQTVIFNSGILNLLFQDGFNTAGSVKIFDFDAYGGAGLSTVNVTGLADGYSASFNTTNGIVTVIPEPSICLLGSLGVLALLRRRR